MDPRIIGYEWMTSPKIANYAGILDAPQPLVLGVGDRSGRAGKVVFENSQAPIEIEIPAFVLSKLDNRTASHLDHRASPVSQASQALQQIPVRGLGLVTYDVFQARTQENMAYDNFHSVTLAKVRDTITLDELFTLPFLDYFLILSLAVNVTSAGGQANYNAANAVRDALAHTRRVGSIIGHLVTWISVDAANVSGRHGSVLELGLDSLVAIELRNWITHESEAPLQSRDDDGPGNTRSSPESRIILASFLSNADTEVTIPHKRRAYGLRDYQVVEVPTLCSSPQPLATERHRASHRAPGDILRRRGGLTGKGKGRSGKRRRSAPGPRIGLEDRVHELLGQGVRGTLARYRHRSGFTGTPFIVLSLIFSAQLIDWLGCLQPYPESRHFVTFIKHSQNQLRHGKSFATLAEYIELQPQDRLEQNAPFPATNGTVLCASFYCANSSSNSALRSGISDDLMCEVTYIVSFPEPGDAAPVAIVRETWSSITSRARTGRDAKCGNSIPSQSNIIHDADKRQHQQDRDSRRRSQWSIDSLFDCELATRLPVINQHESAGEKSYVDCTQISPDFESSVARTNNYNTTGGSTGDGQGSIDSPMAVAINTGIINPPKHIPSLKKFAYQARRGPELIKVAKANIDAAPEPSSSEGQEETVWYPEDCVWSFDEKSRYAILQELMSQTGGVAVGTIAARNLWMNGTTNIASINSYFQKLPDIMTAMIRNQGGRAALVGLAILFLVLVFSQGPRELSFRAWKSSPLALLFLSMDESRYDVNYYGMTKNDINHFAESVSVQLKRDQEGRVTFS
ncbi:hypothetical protein CHU98_g3774 [Xylaria longipes]|nr:hypothetical protein CHU98_g3774 [Xylaria longipes]